MTAQTDDKGLLIEPTATSGVFTVRRKEGEHPFAELHAPAARHARTWGIKYRDQKAEPPFDPQVFNSAPATRNDAIYELARVVRVSSDYQLGLAPYTPKGK